jgi:hypothetical protein
VTALFSFLLSEKFLAGLLTGGGLVAAWKWIAGWNLINLSLVIENSRTPFGTSGTDNLVSTLKLKKGNRATLAVESIRFAVTANGREIGNGTVDDIKLSEIPRSLNITPGEETHFGFHCVVASDIVCKVTVTVTGRSLRTKRAPLGVWKASAFSVPEPPKGASNAAP